MNRDSAIGAVWRLWHGETEVARLTVTDADFPWLRATVEELPGYEPFRALFAAQEQAALVMDTDRCDELYFAIRQQLRMTCPDGRPVAEFMLDVYGDGTAGWRWSDVAFEQDTAQADHDAVMAAARRIIATDAAIIHRLGTA